MNIEQLQAVCCGCGGCAQLCPKQAITMQPNEDGFLYPHVDYAACTDCGLCTARCPVAQQPKAEPVSAYYGWNKDTSVRMASSSGGVFSALAEGVLEKNGVVYGAAFDAKTKRVIYQSTDKVSLDDLRRSKYTESDTANSFTEIKELLNAGRLVLFCGTPCHVAGLKSFLGKGYNNLYTCDFVCGGSASPAFFVEHLQLLEKRYGARVSQLNFRDKKMGWKRMLLHVQFENGRHYCKLSYFDSYFNGFIEGISKRSNCFACPFAAEHLADITIADYWGYRNANVPYDEKGISMLVVNTPQGDGLLQEVKDRLELTQMDLERTHYTIRPRVADTKKLEKRNVFFGLARKLGFERAAKRSYMKHPYMDVLLSYLHLK